MNEVVIIGRVLPASGKIHQNQEIYHGGGCCGTLKSTHYKDPPKVAVECKLIGNLTNGVYAKMHDISRRVYDTDGISPTIHTMGGGNLEPKILEPVSGQFRPKDRNYNLHGEPRIEQFETRTDSLSNAVLTYSIKNCIAEPCIAAMRGRNPLSPTSRKCGEQTEQMLEIKDDGTSNTLTTVQKDNLLVYCIGNVNPSGKGMNGNVFSSEGLSPTLTTNKGEGAKIANTQFRVRKLTPLECWRLMGFSDDDFYKAKKALNEKFYNGADRSNSQLYKQAGNSIVVPVLMAIKKQMLRRCT